MKAWVVRPKYEGYSTVVFAETRGQAKTFAMRTDCCEDTDFIDVRCHRFPEADAMFDGQMEMDWDNSKDRLFLVKHGWYCEYPEYEDCLNCVAKDYCNYKEEMSNDN